MGTQQCHVVDRGRWRLWLLGGEKTDGGPTDAELLNDLWKYDPGTGDWTWMKGDSTTTSIQPGVYGTRGTPDPANLPGARKNAASWTDDEGALWLFGGTGKDDYSRVGYLNDLWKYDPATGNWTWMEGATTYNQPGNYGTMGVSSSSNTPGGRLLPSSWKDTAGNFWLFGGAGLDGMQQMGLLSDLWKYDPLSGNWTWMKGPLLVNQTGVCGTVGTPDSKNMPCARLKAASWTDEAGALLLFGGWGYAESGKMRHLDDLWKYEPATGNWTCLKEASPADHEAVYGTLGVPDPANIPGERHGISSWADEAGELWIFGGREIKLAQQVNDLWKYDLTTGNWTWMEGDGRYYRIGRYGTLGVPDPSNSPGGRFHSVSWTDAMGHLWLFGGWGHGEGLTEGYLNDLWEYDPETDNWTWRKGAAERYQTGIYGTIGVPDSANTPGARNNGVSWIDPTGSLWLFGGYGKDETGSWEWFNDLWRYNPATGNWTWMKGAQTVGQSAVYGTLGVPDSANTPPSYSAPVSWVDATGGLWLLGDNDLWKYDTATGNWTWMKGSDSTKGIYGTLGVPDPANIPGTRSNAVSWTDAAGNFWLFGGYGADSTSTIVTLNDLWKYEPATGNWTWMKGASKGAQQGTYGNLGVPDPANTPGARTGSVTWADESGALWLFAGNGIDSAGNRGVLNDLWKYEPTTGNWTWVHGDPVIEQRENLETYGTPHPGNAPRSRSNAVSWRGTDGSMWLFGGSGLDCNGSSMHLNDLWQLTLADTGSANPGDLFVITGSTAAPGAFAPTPATD
ncbi:MAG: hypothetical protein PWP23_2465 [Candidatus Sumerlaeota bacterium]|nr:hypothetical protein [Candidatus Sumerlaeota bacterium]